MATAKKKKRALAPSGRNLSLVFTPKFSMRTCRKGEGSKLVGKKDKKTNEKIKKYNGQREENQETKSYTLVNKAFEERQTT